MAKCQGCGAEIIWMRTGAGKYIPCNPGLKLYRENKHGHERIVSPNGEVIACELTDTSAEATGVGLLPHWGTCPKAGNFRRRNEK